MKPKLLLHVCCAPDAAYAIELLKDTYDLHCFFYNPNIFPLEEYELRLDEMKKVALIYNVSLTWDWYSTEKWSIAVDGLTDTPEGGERCDGCFTIRLARTAKICSKMGLPAFGTVMSVSPHKNVSMLDRAGKFTALIHGVDYVPFNFKKQDGFKKSIALSQQLGLYRQNYCGCHLSRDEATARRQHKI